VLIDDPERFDGVQVIGVDEHCWRHTRRGDKFVTVVIDLSPVRDGTPPRRSTAGPSTCAAPPSASATSPTTSPDQLLEAGGFRPQFHLRL
jgi:hypothetical protein